MQTRNAIKGHHKENGVIWSRRDNSKRRKQQHKSEVPMRKHSDDGCCTHDILDHDKNTVTVSPALRNLCSIFVTSLQDIPHLITLTHFEETSKFEG